MPLSSGIKMLNGLLCAVESLWCCLGLCRTPVCSAGLFVANQFGLWDGLGFDLLWVWPGLGV